MLFRHQMKMVMVAGGDEVRERQHVEVLVDVEH
jgi:hypothetical protein